MKIYIEKTLFHDRVGGGKGRRDGWRNGGRNEEGKKGK